MQLNSVIGRYLDRSFIFENKIDYTVFSNKPVFSTILNNFTYILVITGKEHLICSFKIFFKPQALLFLNALTARITLSGDTETFKTLSTLSNICEGKSSVLSALLFSSIALGVIYLNIEFRKNNSITFTECWFITFAHFMKTSSLYKYFCIVKVSSCFVQFWWTNLRVINFNNVIIIIW